ncbi:MAG: ADP-ribosylation factor-like protein [Candidatus Helarchaeota archaeon]
MRQMYKIIFIGLDFAGKTSILRILEGGYSKIDKIKPTVGTERAEWNILGFKVINWDLGGQKQFREDYLANYKQMLDETNLIVFVIDMQDDSRFNEAGAYFDDILHALDHLKIKCPIVLCLHKVDPDIIYNASMITNLNWVTNLFSDYSHDHDFEIKVFITSIFDRKSLIEMFSYSIGRLMPLSILSQILEDFIQQTKSLGILGAILLDPNLFVVGTAFFDSNDKTFAYKTINAFLTLIGDFQNLFDENQKAYFDISLGNDKIYKFRLNKITEMNPPYYLLVMGTSSFDIDEIYSLFRTKFVSVIEKRIIKLVESVE